MSDFEQFEKWALDNQYEKSDLSKHADGEYVFDYTAYLYAGWKAAIASMQGEAKFNATADASKIAEQDARIKELEQQLEAAWIPMSQQTPIEEHGYKVLGFGDGYVFECEYECRDGEGNWCNITGETMTHWMPLPPKPDAAIRQIGGAE